MAIFLPADPHSFQAFHNYITIYEQASGAKLNISKSTVIPIGISPTPQWLHNTGCIIAKPGGITHYLGVPIGVRLSTTQIQSYCLDRVCKQISSWKTKLLSFISRTILIKHILMAIPVYHQMYMHFSTRAALQLQQQGFSMGL